MANLRNLKKEIDYRLEEVVFDCDMAICFQPSKEKEIFEVMQEAVGVRNDLTPRRSNSVVICFWDFPAACAFFTYSTTCSSDMRWA